MKDLILAFGLLLVGFIALQKRATREPFDYRVALLEDAKNDESLASAFEKALKKKNENSKSTQSEPR